MYGATSDTKHRSKRKHLPESTNDTSKEQGRLEVMKKMLMIILIPMLCCLNGASRADELQKGNIHPGIKLSFTERFRMVTWDNAVNLSETAGGGNSFTRHRTSLMSQWFLLDDLELALKLTNEFRYYFVPENREFSFGEVIVDQLYAKYDNKVGIPGTLTLGRQNIILGEGFIVLDGDPLDGSRSIYFNAVRFDWRVGRENTLTLFYSYQQDIDDMLPIIHDKDVRLIEQPEEGLTAYFRGTLNSLKYDTYFIRKNIKGTNDISTSSHIKCLGARVHMPLVGGLTVTGEGGYQFGNFGVVDRSAFGGYVHTDYTTTWASYLPHSFTVGGIYLSGNDPSTEDWEAWDPLFARWPKWSESYIYTEIKERGVAYWSNLLSLYGQTKFVITKNISFALSYHRLMAPEKPVGNDSFPGGTGNIRGDLVTGKLIYQFNTYFSGHVIWETFDPGDFYFNDADGYNWARAELMLKL